jgi:hypothetical protein
MGAELHLAQLVQENAQLKGRVAELEPYQQRAAELERELARRKGHDLLYCARIAHLQRDLEFERTRWMKNLEWFANPNIKPGPKVVGFNLLVHAGGLARLPAAPRAQ